MNWTIYIFGSGLSLFVGVTFLLAAIVPSIAKARFVRLRSLLALIGIIFLALSAAPLPLWAFGATSVLLVAWLVTVGKRPISWQQANTAISVLAFVGLVAVAGHELRYQYPSPLTPMKNRQLYLFGDSLAAGIGHPNEDNWPELMSHQHQLQLLNVSSPGDTISKACEKAKITPLRGGLVLLEIGGNDLLDGVSVVDFERDLNDLLAEVTGPDRQVAMFELPLPPFHNGYGIAQRRLAAQYGVHLIHKRVLMGVVATEGATVDTLHLSPAGHKQLADAVWRQMEPAFASGK